MNKLSSFVLSFCALFAAILLNSCSQTDSMNMPSKSGTYIGETKAFGSDSIRSWVKTDDNGNPSSMGVTFKESALNSLETDHDTMTMLMLSTMMSGSMMTMAMPFDHVEVDWVPKGDPSPSPYDKAHLDCHFFTVSMMDQMGMMGGMDTTKMDMKYLPNGYMMDEMAEEGMGVHCMDTTSKEFHGQPFDHTLGYGFYHGNMAFMETMCAKSFLDSKTSGTFDIKQPQAFKKSGYYPLQYTVSYDAAKKEYSISLDKLTSH